MTNLTTFNFLFHNLHFFDITHTHTHTRTHTHTHHFNNHFLCKPGLASCALDSQSPVILMLSILTVQAESSLYLSVRSRQVGGCPRGTLDCTPHLNLPSHRALKRARCPSCRQTTSVKALKSHDMTASVDFHDILCTYYKCFLWNTVADHHRLSNGSKVKGHRVYWDVGHFSSAHMTPTVNNNTTVVTKMTYSK